MEQIDEAQARVRQPLQHVERVAHVEADIGEMPVADMAERADHAVEERLGADEAVIGQQIGAVGEMLAGAEADLEMKRAVVAEQGARIDRPLVGHAQRRQQSLDQARPGRRATCRPLARP